MSAFVEERRCDFGVEPICRALGVSASAYYERRSGRRSARRVSDEHLLAKIEEVHAGAYHAYGSRRVMRTDLVLDALRMALGLRSPGADVALVHHSDRGSQYTSAEFTQALNDNDVLGSLGSTGIASITPSPRASSTPSRPS
jgi:hypothetical protein